MLGTSARRWFKGFDVQIVVALTALTLGLGVVRGWNIWITDIFVSDEYGYITSAFQGQVSNVVLGYRSAFAYTNNALFWLFNINSTDRLTAVMPLYIALWDVIAIISVWQVLRLLGHQPRTIGLTLIAFVCLPAFLIPSLGFFTEGMALAYASLGLYLVLRCLKNLVRVRGAIFLFLSGVAFWLAMHGREPYALLFLGLGLVPIASSFTTKSWKVPLVAGLICLIVAQGVVSAVQDPIGNETQQSFNSFGQTFVISPLIALFGVQHPVGTTTTVSTTTVSTTTTSTTVMKTAVVTSTIVSNGQTITTTITQTAVSQVFINTTFTITIPVTNVTTPLPSPPIQATGILAFLGISTVPSSIILRSLLLVLVSLMAGYGVLLPLPIAGACYLFYEVLSRRRLESTIPIVLLALIFLATLAGVTLVFASDPSYFGSQHYSALLRFASTTTLAFPLLVAPFIDRLSKNKKLISAVVILFVLLYALTAQAILGAAVTNLESYNNPLSFQAPQYSGPIILFRDYVVSHPSASPFVVVGLDSSLLPWTPGLSARNDVAIIPYMNETQFASAALTNFYLFVPPSGFPTLLRDYPLLGALAYNALTGNSSAVGGFHGVAVVFDNSYGLMIQVSRLQQ